MKTIFLACPRGFCAGVVRAIACVEKAIEKFGAPIYVRHEIVHNAHVVADLKQKGAIFIDDLREVPDDRPVVFSAHGVPKSVPAEAQARHLIYVDATCPLVSKVHREIENHVEGGYHVILIGHRNHIEVIGSMGQVSEGTITLVETVSDVDKLPFHSETQLAYATQTTLSVEETADMIRALKNRYPKIQEPRKDDICYATTNRQNVVKEIAPNVQVFIIVGSSHSSNSKRLVETARRYGCSNAQLIEDVHALDWQWISDADAIGLSSGASAPDELVQRILKEIQNRFLCKIQEIIHQKEVTHFHLPRILRSIDPAQTVN